MFCVSSCVIFQPALYSRSWFWIFYVLASHTDAPDSLSDTWSASSGCSLVRFRHQNCLVRSTKRLFHRGLIFQSPMRGSCVWPNSTSQQLLLASHTDMCLIRMQKYSWVCTKQWEMWQIKGFTQPRNEIRLSFLTMNAVLWWSCYYLICCLHGSIKSRSASLSAGQPLPLSLICKTACVHVKPLPYL